MSKNGDIIIHLHLQVLCELGMISKDEIWQEEPISPNMHETPITEEAIEKLLPTVETFLFVCATIAVVVIAVFIKYML